MKPFLFVFLFLITNMYAQKQVLLRINERGVQEAIPILPNEKTIDAINRVEKQLLKNEQPLDFPSKLKYYDSTAAASNFGFNHQDVMLTWFRPVGGGIIKSIVWRNYGLRGDIGKATIRAWKVDPRLATLPVTAGANGSRSAMGYYVDANDGDGNVTAFKNKATDTTFKPAVGNLDSASVSFDPLGKEASWLPNGLQVTLDSERWQGINFGDLATFKQNELFGFTLQNDSPPGGADTRMEMWAYGNSNYPFHSYKFYEASRAGNKGWHIRGDFEWQMYAVVEFTSVPPPRIYLQKLFTTVYTVPRTVKATVLSNYKIKSVDLYAKVNSGAWVKSAMVGSEPNYTGTLPGANPTDTVTYYAIATDVNNDVSNPSPTYFYTIFQPTSNVLYLYNGRSIPNGFTIKSIAPYYMLRDSLKEKPYYDTWDVKSYGKIDIPQLLTHYKVVNEVAGVGGYEDLTSMAGTWLSGATVTNKRIWIFADQDHTFSNGWPGTGKDTSLNATDDHAKYFGIQAFINQDYPGGTTKPWKINVDTTKGIDPVFGFIAQKIKKDTVKFWYEPAYEISSTFTNWMDEITPTPDATVIFKDGNKVLGVTKRAADLSWYTYALMFDYLGTNFRTDTTGGHTAKLDSAYKYMWIVNAGHVMKNVMALVTGVEKINLSVPTAFALFQNYPNPFNPATTISYTVGTSDKTFQNNGNGFSFVTLKIYDVLGKEIATLVNEKQNAGTYRVNFSGATLPTGVYFYRLQSRSTSRVFDQTEGGQAGSFVETKKLLLLK